MIPEKKPTLSSENGVSLFFSNVYKKRGGLNGLPGVGEAGVGGLTCAMMS